MRGYGFPPNVRCHISLFGELSWLLSTFTCNVTGVGVLDVDLTGSCKMVAMTSAKNPPRVTTQVPLAICIN